jgi:hypothetical protein
MIMENTPPAKYERENTAGGYVPAALHPPEIKFFQNVVSCGTGRQMMTVDVLLWIKIQERVY